MGYVWRDLGASGEPCSSDSIAAGYEEDLGRYWTGLKEPHYSQLASLGELFSKRQESSHERDRDGCAPSFY
jgi:hypothetical protein